MTLSVAGKYAIITGGGSGINLAFARLLLSKGCSVLIGDLSLRPESEKLLAEYPYTSRGPTQSKPAALFHKTDVSSWPDLTSLMRRGTEAFPQVDIVVAGAGIFEPTWSKFWYAPGASPEARDDPAGDPGTYATLNVNLTHTIRLAQLAVGHWTTGKRPGTFMAVSSCAGHAVGVGSPIYHAAKFGVHGFVRSLGALRDEVGVRVCAVAPGNVKTPMWFEDPEKQKMTGSKQDIFMEPEEVAEAMLELCENPEYGDGTVLEVLKGQTRTVPLYGLTPPDFETMVLPGYQDSLDQLLKRLKTEGLKVEESRAGKARL